MKRVIISCVLPKTQAETSDARCDVIEAVVADRTPGPTVEYLKSSLAWVDPSIVYKSHRNWILTWKETVFHPDLWIKLIWFKNKKLLFQDQYSSSRGDGMVLKLRHPPEAKMLDGYSPNVRTIAVFSGNNWNSLFSIHWYLYKSFTRIIIYIFDLLTKYCY